jgi:hypothetical protein
MNFVRKILLMTLLFNPMFVMAGTWTVSNPKTLTFEGSITQGEFDRFKAVYSPTIETLIVKSGGGLTIEGLPIGEVLATNPKLTIIVNEYCMSSCANYFFTAAKKKILRGLVGFHGNIVTTMNSPKQLEFMRQLRESDPQTYEKETEQQREFMLRESRFLQIVNVKQELFVKSVVHTTGEAGHKMWIPNLAVMAAYGIHEINGDQTVPNVLANYDFYFDSEIPN